MCVGVCGGGGRGGNGEKKSGTRPPVNIEAFLPLGTLQTELSLHGLNTATERLPWKPARQKIRLPLVTWPRPVPSIYGQIDSDGTEQLGNPPRNENCSSVYRVFTHAVCPWSNAARIDERGVKHVERVSAGRLLGGHFASDEFSTLAE